MSNIMDNTTEDLQSLILGAITEEVHKISSFLVPDDDYSYQYTLQRGIPLRGQLLLARSNESSSISWEESLSL